MQNSINVLKDTFSKQEDIDSFITRITRYLDGLFAMGEYFDINSFNTVLSSLADKEFAQAMYMVIITYDDNAVMESLSSLENEKLIQVMTDLANIYGPRLETHYIRQVQTYNIKNSDTGYRKMHGQYQICLELENYANQKIFINEDPNNILMLSSKIVESLKEIAEFTKLDKELVDELKKQIKKL